MAPAHGSSAACGLLRSIPARRCPLHEPTRINSSDGTSPALTTIDCTTLVGRLIDPEDDAAWELVVARYGPAVRGFARKLGLDAHGADDACQTTMIEFVLALRGGRYDRERGRLRDLLFGIARHRIRDLVNACRKLPVQVAGDHDRTDFFERIPTPDALSCIWDEEWHDAVYSQCLAEAKAHFSSEAYTAFYLRSIDGQPSATVAETIGKTANAVDIMNHRVREYLRQIRPHVERLF